VTGRTYCIGTASQSIVKHSHSGQLEPMKMKGEHPWGGGECCSSHPPNVEIKKRINSFVYIMLSNVFCDLPFSQTQSLKLDDD